MPEIVATVVEGEIQVDGQTDFIESDGNDYADTMSYNRYDSDPHVYLLPITSPDGFGGQTAAFVQLAAETLVWTHDWTVARMGARPNIPAPNVSDPNWVLLRKMPETAMITVGPDGTTPLFRVSGAYVYGRKDATSDTYANVTFPKSQIIEDDFPRTISASQLEGGLSSPQAGGGGGAFPGNPGLVPGGPVMG